jgi:hypothetical protein
MWSKSKLALGLSGLALFAGAVMADTSQATESGESIYLLGSGGPGVAIMPPVKGIFFQNLFYSYNGDASAKRNFQIGGNVVAGIQANVPADFPILAWVPTTNLLGGTLAVGPILVIGGPAVDVGAIITGPRGRQIAVATHDSTFVFGDPLFQGALGWHKGDLHWQFSSWVNVPIGNYREGALANIAFHRWAGDTSGAVTWHDDKAGWDVSGKAGFTFNGTNNATQYTTGTEFHAEAAIEKLLSKSFSIGLQSYFFDQVTGDSGSGNRIGPFKGRVLGVGGEGAYNFMVGKAPVTMRVEGFNEFDARNRLEGRAIFLNLSMPLWVRLPKAPS